MTANRVKLVHRYGVVDAYLPDGRLIGTMRRITKASGATWSGWAYEVYGTRDGDGCDGATKAEAVETFLAELANGTKFLRAYGDEDCFPQWNLNRKVTAS